MLHPIFARQHQPSSTYLPNDVEKLRKLRFLYARRFLKNQSFTCYGGIEVPRGIRHT